LQMPSAAGKPGAMSTVREANIAREIITDKSPGYRNVLNFRPSVRSIYLRLHRAWSRYSWQSKRADGVRIQRDTGRTMALGKYRYIEAYSTALEKYLLDR
jgi:hypothetical protein